MTKWQNLLPLTLAHHSWVYFKNRHLFCKSVAFTATRQVVIQNRALFVKCFKWQVFLFQLGGDMPVQWEKQYGTWNGKPWDWPL